MTKILNLIGKLNYASSIQWNPKSSIKNKTKQNINKGQHFQCQRKRDKFTDKVIISQLFLNEKNNAEQNDLNHIYIYKCEVLGSIS